MMESFGFPAIEGDVLERIIVPTALVWGRHDLATPLSVAEEASARYGWPLRVIEGSADDPAIEQPEAFMRVLRGVLEADESRIGGVVTAVDERAAGTDRSVRMSEAAHTLLPAIAARIGEIEDGRRIPPDMVEDLKAAGCFRSLVPRDYGGDEHDLATHMRVLEELARTDGSVGWTVMIGASAPTGLGSAAGADVRGDVRRRGPTSWSAGRSIRPDQPCRPTVATWPADGGRSRAGANTATGSSPTASSTTVACLRYG